MKKMLQALFLVLVLSVSAALATEGGGGTGHGQNEVNLDDESLGQVTAAALASGTGCGIQIPEYSGSAVLQFCAQNFNTPVEIDYDLTLARCRLSSRGGVMRYSAVIRTMAYLLAGRRLSPMEAEQIAACLRLPQ